MHFIYSIAASSFLSERIDENPKYSDAVKLFEFVIGKNCLEGLIVARWKPLVARCFVASLPIVKDLAFFYIIAYGTKKDKSILVGAVEFVPLPKK